MLIKVLFCRFCRIRFGFSCILPRLNYPIVLLKPIAVFMIDGVLGQVTGMCPTWKTKVKIKRHVLDILKRTPRFERYRFVKALLELKQTTDAALRAYFEQLFCGR